MTCKIYFDELVLSSDSDIVSHNLPANFLSYGLVVNSKKVESGFIFCAIKGKKFDGHDFVEEAIKNGANALIVEELASCKDIIEKHKIPYVEVKNTINAIQNIARYRRKNILQDAKLIAVTGSFGKTSLTYSLGKALSKFCSTSYTSDNENNEIGLPLTIINASKSASIVVAEMGMRNKGEIDFLSEIANPDIAIISGIGSAHIGNFEDGIDGIINTKMEIVNHMKKGGVLLLSEESEHFDKLSKIAKEKNIQNILRVGKDKSSHLYIKSISSGPFLTKDYEVKVTGLGEETINCSINNFSKSSSYIPLFTFAIARLFKMDLNSAAKALGEIEPVSGRGNAQYIFYDKKKVIIIDESYNSSPESLANAIETLSEIKEENSNNRVICVAGDMLELGEKSREYHLEISKSIKNSKIDKIITVGKEMEVVLDSLPEKLKIAHFKSISSFNKEVRELLEDGDIVMFKGSNAIRLYVAIDKLLR